MKKCRILKSLTVLFLCTLSVFWVLGFSSQPAGHSQDLREIHCKHFIYGIPLGTPASNDLIIRDICALSSNNTTKFADRVVYRLDPETVQGDAVTKRVWKADPWLAEDETLEPEDYKGAHKALNTDRGHQALLASFKGTNGAELKSIQEIFRENDIKLTEYVSEYRIDIKARSSLLRELSMLGISAASIFPDLDQLAIDLRKDIEDH
ncbi:MAG: DNA/RNA non-specific endonuclease [Candidatus Hydrogenedentota bacterium]|nr:MAG: DNA/RNA non-specific endonuclease [Candidatus Hydrogenedentota bacterium]